MPQSTNPKLLQLVVEIAGGSHARSAELLGIDLKELESHLANPGALPWPVFNRVIEVIVSHQQKALTASREAREKLVEMTRKPPAGRQG